MNLQPMDTLLEGVHMATCTKCQRSQDSPKRPEAFTKKKSQTTVIVDAPQQG